LIIEEKLDDKWKDVTSPNGLDDIFNAILNIEGESYASIISKIKDGGEFELEGKTYRARW